VRVVTALRAGGRDRVDVELDGAAWRTLPLEAVVRAGLTVGAPLDRVRARELARTSRRIRAFGTAGRALRRRDLSKEALDGRLERAGVAAADRRETLAALERAGIVDDERYAVGRAQALAQRGYGDAAIRWQLEQQGIQRAVVDAAVAELEPEAERAARIVAARGSSPSVARLLARRGFDAAVVEDVLDRAG
jgi:regulatory protein